MRKHPHASMQNSLILKGRAADQHLSELRASIFRQAAYPVRSDGRVPRGDDEQAWMELCGLGDGTGDRLRLPRVEDLKSCDDSLVVKVLAMMARWLGGVRMLAQDRSSRHPRPHQAKVGHNFALCCLPNHLVFSH